MGRRVVGPDRHADDRSASVVEHGADEDPGVRQQVVDTQDIAGHEGRRRRLIEGRAAAEPLHLVQAGGVVEADLHLPG
ncbi:MAG: hypothetical protein ACXWBN_02320, partial [Acidimicrobiales bacterium]